MKKLLIFSVAFSLIVLILPSLNLSQEATQVEVMPALPGYVGSAPAIVEPPEVGNVSAPPISPRSRSRHSYDYVGMVSGDYDADGYDEIAFDYGSSGIWMYDPNAGTKWNQISTEDPDWMIAIRISSTADDELLAEFPTGASNRWWNYSGYPGTWSGMTGSPANYAYDMGDIGDGDAGHEVLVDFAGLGLYVMDYTGSGIFGGFNAHHISSNDVSGEAISLGDPDYEAIHSFSDGVKYWNYASGYPATWYKINDNPLSDDNVACDIDGGDDEYICDFGQSLGLWEYKHSTGTWTRLSYSWVQEAWPYASGVVGAQYEIAFTFYPDIGLWDWNDGTDWERLNWNIPTYLLGADVYAANGGDELVGDFGTLGVWVQYFWRGSWTRINWNNPEYFIAANLDADPELEIVFDFGGLGVWTWDQPTNAWTRINWGSPEASAVQAPNKD